MSQMRPYRSIIDRFRPKVHRPRRADYRLISSIRARAKKFEPLSAEKFLEAADDLRGKLLDGQSQLEIQNVVESFALTAEALRRATGKVYYDVQLLGGLVLATGGIAEMQTGEGKTITCGLPAVLHGLSRKGVHVSTTNAYLAERDQEELVPVFEQLGITSGLIKNDQDPEAKKQAYQCDVTYGTGDEFGFDFLRDQLAIRNRPHLPLGTRFLSRLRGFKFHEITLMQRELHYAIVDEADSVLIDEAATPLILSGSGGRSVPNPEVYRQAMSVALSLKEGADYETDWVKRTIELTESGWKVAHDSLSGSVQAHLQRPWSQYVEQSIRAQIMLTSDVDYVVHDDQIVIVDQNTGRLHDERKWRSGLHQAIETKEGVTLTEEREIEARITRQRYFKFYDMMAGMTGTAEGNEAELLEFYDLPVVQIPRNKPSGRVEIPARYFGDASSKFDAIVADAVERASNGQPILVGTKTITQSREIANRLRQRNQEHTVLNGTQDETEAAVITDAGKSGVITIATNMAGRGTDIRLSEESRNAGGLHVIVAEHHDSPRVDRQLVGRAARQSDPGSCQFFVSATDDIIDRYGASLAEKMKRSTKGSDGVGECRHSFTKEINDLQAKIERINFASRKKLVVHDNWMETVQESIAKTA